MPTIVVSAPNLVEGGPLQVLRDCVAALAQVVDRVSPVVVLNNPALIPDYPGIEKLIRPDPKKSWLRRMRYEYLEAEKICRKFRPDVWLSLHDITSRVSAPAKFVYCHNPSPFYALTAREAFLEPKFALFNAFYDRLYALNIRTNTAVIVQQQWLREEFLRRYRPRQVVTAWPHTVPLEGGAPPPSVGAKRVFLYPAFPRVFKNFEVICDAVRQLQDTGRWDGEVRFTISGSENRYAHEIAAKVADIPSIRLIGLQDLAGMRRQYAEADVVLFPSKLETWGLPISEAREWGKTILLADLPYAHETLGVYGGAMFLDPLSPRQWAAAMRAAREGRLTADPPANNPASPDFRTWGELVAFMVGTCDKPAL